MTTLATLKARRDKLRQRQADARAAVTEGKRPTFPPEDYDGDIAELDREIADVESRALSRSAIKAMQPAEFEKRQTEIERWVAAGAVDGEPAPDVRRPSDHVFTRDEIRGLSVDEFAANEPAILDQLRAGGVK